jgi:hypothetical protein
LFDFELKLLCKISKGNKNSEKNKKKEQKKRGTAQLGPARDPTGPIRPEADLSPLPPSLPFFLFLFHFGPTGGTHLSSPTFSCYSSLVTEATDPAPLPLVNPQQKRPDHAYKTPTSPSPFFPFSLF